MRMYISFIIFLLCLTPLISFPASSTPGRGIINPTNPPSGVTVSPMTFEQLDPSLAGDDFNESWIGYAITASGIWDIQLSKPAAYTNNWFCWLQIEGYVLSCPLNPLPEATPSYTFEDVDFGNMSTIYAVLNDNHTIPVELSSFTGLLTAEHTVRLQWTTESETNLVGYKLYRNESNDLASAIQAPMLIEATNTSTTQTYAYADSEVENHTTYYYWLNSISLDGSSQYHGPVSVTVEYDEEPPVIPIYFHGVLTAENNVRLEWTYFDTGLQGYRLYRSQSNAIEQASLITPNMIPAFNDSTLHSFSYIDDDVENHTTYYYWLQCVQVDSSTELHGPVTVNVVYDDPPPVVVTTVATAYPNPCHDILHLDFSIKSGSPASATILILNTELSMVKEVLKTFVVPGLHTANPDISDLPDGLYRVYYWIEQDGTDYYAYGDFIKD